MKYITALVLTLACCGASYAAIINVDDPTPLSLAGNVTSQSFEQELGNYTASQFNADSGTLLTNFDASAFSVGDTLGSVLYTQALSGVDFRINCNLSGGFGRIITNGSTFVSSSPNALVWGNGNGAVILFPEFVSGAVVSAPIYGVGFTITRLQTTAKVRLYSDIDGNNQISSTTVFDANNLGSGYSFYGYAGDTVIRRVEVEVASNHFGIDDLIVTQTSIPKSSYVVPQTRDVDIILPSSPNDTESFAASELKHYLELIRGATVTINGSVSGAYPIYLGDTSASDKWRDQLTDPLPETADEVFVVEVTSAETVLAGGGDRGILYAAYAFLEDLGCRWLEPVSEVVPDSPDLTLPVSERVERPAMTIRHIGTSGQLPDPANRAPNEIKLTVDWMVKNRLNFSYSLRPQILYQLMTGDDRFLWQDRGGMVHWQHIVHNFEYIVPNDTYFDTNPEYYALYKGQRVPLGAGQGNLALTNPSVRTIASNFVTDWFNANSDGRVVPLVPPDGDIKWDESPAAMALGGENFVPGPLGSMTRRMVEFSTAVANQVVTSHPDRFILNLAYSNYVEPYPGVSLPGNVIAQVSHGYAGQGSIVHSIYSDLNQDARDIFESWADSGAGGIGIWDYFILHVPTNAGSAKTPLGFARLARDMVGYLEGLTPDYKVYFTQAGNEHWQYNAFLYWAVAQLAWNPDATVNELIETWTKAAFGSAWSHAYDYLTALETAYDNDNWSVSLWREVNVPSSLIFTESFVQTAQSQLAALDAGLSAGNTVGQGLYTDMQASLDFVEEAVVPQWVFGGTGDWLINRGANDYEINTGGPATVDSSWLQDMANGDAKTLRHLTYRSDKRTESIVWLENTEVKIGILPGIGGRIIRMIDLSSGDNLLYEPLTSRLADTGNAYFRYGGYEEYTGDDFASPGWEVPLALESSDPDNVTVGGVVDGVDITRTYTLQDGTASKLIISTTLENVSTQARQTRIRVHPEFKLDEALDRTYLVVENQNNGFDVSNLALSGSTISTSASTWGVYSPANAVVILNEFNTNEVDQLHLHLDHTYQSFNLELFGDSVLLQPGQSLTLQHEYRIYTGTNATSLFPGVAIPADLRANWVVTEAPGATGDGVSGEAVYRNTESPIVLQGSLPHDIGLEGTIECSFKMDALADGVLFSFGNKSPDWMIAQISAGNLYFYRIRGDSPYDDPDEGWAKLQVDVSSIIQPGVWHDLKIAWDGTGGTGAGRMFVSIDGQILDDRSNLTVRSAVNSRNFVIGSNILAFNSGKFPGLIDQVRIYDTLVPNSGGSSPTPLVKLDKKP
ncbi:DUF4838 domain-containing protein [Rubellicoccus peritrichatus]|uniref:DUF4838 domain-containing protein n=1 Tax=Rubellicoccus peritrichatus TaxID=3080537 RepID=A0AAQ3QS20_9BACT|nr:DUF4838 domain-containing protein [Puniceicoccus sp. CR14]WOO41918.1 DUF4838 domain-containing protein [Puniceicoccus sp. CR14]